MHQNVSLQYIYKSLFFLLFSRSVMSDPVTRRLQHAAIPCPSPSPGVCSNSCLLSWWCHPTIPPSVAPFSFCPQSFPASGSFMMSLLFTSSGQRIGASASVLPMNIQGWFPLGWTGVISLQSKGLSRSSPAPQLESISSVEVSYWK